MCTIGCVLTKEDKKYIRDIIDVKLDKKFDEFAILVQNGFKEVMETKSDKSDVEKTERKLTERIDILEYKYIGAHDRRLERVEDDVRVIKSKLKLD